MKAAWYEKLGPATNVLQYGDIPAPEPTSGDVRVKLAISGVNPIDVKRRMGGRGEMTAPRIVPHFDGAGRIDAVGSDVPANRLGQRVWIYEAQWQRDFGTAAEFVTLPAHLAIPLPSSTSFEEGACLGIPAMTAHRAVFIDGSVSGQTVLVTGGAGAVGRYAVQFAKLDGAKTIATVSNEEKANLAASAGADYIINYRTENVVDRIKELTNGAGVDQIVEVEFGGNLETSIEVVKSGGTISTYASQADAEPKLPFYAMMYKSLSIRMVVVFGMPDEAKRQAIDDITRWLSEGKLTHHLGPKFGLSEIVAAHEAVEQGASGKVLVEME